MSQTWLFTLPLACLVGLFLSGQAGAESSPAPKPQPGKQVAQQAQVGDDTTVHYWLYLPEDYQADKKYSLVMFLHGKGERGDNLQNVLKHGPPKLVEAGKQFPFILVSPQLPLTYERWQPAQLLPVLDQLEKDFAVDQQKIYCTGLSMGGGGTWAMGLAAPKRFAALLPVCGKIEREFPEQVSAIKHVPVWAFHGDADRAVPHAESVAMVEALKAADGNVKFTTYPGVAHDSWTQTYNNPQIYEWLLEHSLKP